MTTITLNESESHWLPSVRTAPGYPGFYVPTCARLRADGTWERRSGQRWICSNRASVRKTAEYHAARLNGTGEN
jgi:hypothetical protein